MLKADVTQKRARSVEELIRAIYDSWKNLDKTIIVDIFNSIYNRIDMLIGGGDEPLRPLRY